MVTPANNSYAPPRSTVADVTAGDESEKASRASRLFATILDGLIFTIPFAPSYFIAIPRLIGSAKLAAQAKPMRNLTVWSEVASTGGWFFLGLAVGLCTLTLTAVLVHRNGQTIGKKLLGIKVVRKDGSRATLGRIFWLRYFVNTLFTLIPVLGSIYALVDILLIFGDAKRCVHDHLADTIVVRA